VLTKGAPENTFGSPPIFLEYFRIPTQGKHAMVIGRSPILKRLIIFCRMI
jgi:hypothetical protein